MMDRRTTLGNVLASTAVGATAFAGFATWERWSTLTRSAVALAALVGAGFAIQAVVWNWAHSKALPALGIDRDGLSLVGEADGKFKADWAGIGLAYAYFIPLGVLLVANMALVVGMGSPGLRSLGFVMLLMPLITHTQQASERRRGVDHEALARKRQELAAERDCIMAEARARRGPRPANGIQD